MTIDRHQSFGEYPASERYRRLLEGEGAAAVRLSQGLDAASGVAGAAFGKLKGLQRDARQRRADKRAIESGNVNDLS